MAAHSRLARVAALIQQEIGALFARGLKDPRIGLVTITGAKVSPDLREAWVYYTVHGDESERESTAAGIRAANGFLRRELGKKLTLRVTPELHFVVDEAIDRGDRIDQLLREVERSGATEARAGEDRSAADPVEDLP